MSRKRKAEWLQRVEYALYRAVARRAGNASSESALKWGGRFGSLAAAVIRRRDRRAMRNLRLTFPEKSGVELRRILDECWRHFGAQTVSYIRRQQLPPEEAIGDVEYVNLEILREAQAMDRGVVLISAHYGSWEVGGLTVMALANDVRTVARKLDNDYLEQHLAASRARTGAVVINRRKAARALMKALAEKAVVVMLPDQAVLPREGILVPFLGRPAWTTPAPARPAGATDGATVTARRRRRGRSRSPWRGRRGPASGHPGPGRAPVPGGGEQAALGRCLLAAMDAAERTQFNDVGRAMDSIAIPNNKLDQVKVPCTGSRIPREHC